MKITRRDVLKQVPCTLAAGSIAACGAGLLGGISSGNQAMADDSIEYEPEPERPFRYCLNTGTIRGFNLTLPEEIEVAAEAGYDGIEIWVGNLQKFVNSGGSTEQLSQRINELGITVDGAIGFPRWAVDDDTVRAEGLQQMQREMEMVRSVGGRRIAAPPSGINRESGMDLNAIGRRYRTVLELGQKTGVRPLLEIWGSATTLGTLPEAVYVATAAGHPDASILLDAFHMYKGGSSFEGLKLLNGRAMHLFHINDYPADPPRESIGDGDRVFPGDGVCPMDQLMRTLYDIGFRGGLSLELFNRTYWNDFDNATECAKVGLAKTRACVVRALGRG